MNKEELDKAVLKAVELTNLCMLHMEYHGQKTPECTPQQRRVIKLKEQADE